MKKITNWLKVCIREHGAHLFCAIALTCLYISASANDVKNIYKMFSYNIVEATEVTGFSYKYNEETYNPETVAKIYISPDNPKEYISESEMNRSTANIVSFSFFDFLLIAPLFFIDTENAEDSVEEITAQM